MMTDDVTLEPCPFCGGEAEIIHPPSMKGDSRSDTSLANLPAQEGEG